MGVDCKFFLNLSTLTFIIFWQCCKKMDIYNKMVSLVWLFVIVLLQLNSTFENFDWKLMGDGFLDYYNLLFMVFNEEHWMMLVIKAYCLDGGCNENMWGDRILEGIWKICENKIELNIEIDKVVFFVCASTFCVRTWVVQDRCCFFFWYVASMKRIFKKFQWMYKKLI